MKWKYRPQDVKLLQYLEGSFFGNSLGNIASLWWFFPRFLDQHCIWIILYPFVLLLHRLSLCQEGHVNLCIFLWKKAIQRFKIGTIQNSPKTSRHFRGGIPCCFFLVISGVIRSDLFGNCAVSESKCIHICHS